MDKQYDSQLVQTVSWQFTLDKHFAFPKIWTYYDFSSNCESKATISLLCRNPDKKKGKRKSTLLQHSLLCLLLYATCGLLMVSAHLISGNDTEKKDLVSLGFKWKCGHGSPRKPCWFIPAVSSYPPLSRTRVFCVLSTVSSLNKWSIMVFMPS